MVDGLADRDGADPVFVWHPDLAGKRASEARAAIEADLRSDQRAYALALEGAEQHENDALQSTIALDRKWGPYDLNWAETDPAALADRIVAFEQERERRRDLIPYAEWRAAASPPTPAGAARRASAPDRRTAPPAWLMAVVVVAIVVLLVLLLVGR